jgi:hypothetical protein
MTLRWVAASVAAGIIVGLGATWFTVVRGGGIMGNGVVDGPWHTSLDVGSSEGDMYLRANVAVHGLLALNRNETLYYTASSDSSGVPLSGHCTYRIRGTDPKTRWWSITAYGDDDYLVPNAVHRYSASKNTVHRDPDGSFTVMVSKENGGENWIPVIDGPFTLSLRLYNPDKTVSDDPAAAALPSIEREVC